MITSLIACGSLTAQTWPYYASVGLIGMHIGSQVNAYALNHLANY